MGEKKREEEERKKGEENIADVGEVGEGMHITLWRTATYALPQHFASR
jgi:hypothetical protein